MSYLDRLITTLAALERSGQLAALRTFVMECSGTLYVAGNGGSYAVALHWACDLQKAAGRRCVALGANASLMTAYANDDGYDRVFADELRQIGRAHDRLVLLSCSGTSANIEALRDVAYPRQIVTALITSDCYAGRDALVRIPSRDYGVVEDCFAALGHWLTGEVRG